jgi:DnaJ-class molecular chaperone
LEGEVVQGEVGVLVLVEKPCTVCGGTGRRDSGACPSCLGLGRRHEKVTLKELRQLLER